MTVATFHVDDLIENRYRVLSVLGSGGMGTVYRVSDLLQEGKVLALKTLAGHGAELVDYC